MDFLCGQERESVGEVKPHLVSENGLRPHAGAVMLDHTFVHYPLKEVKILSHTTENCQMIASSNCSSGRRTVVG